MKLEILNKKRENVVHLIHSFKNDYEGMPLQHTQVIGNASKSDPTFISSLHIETLTIFRLENNDYSLETRVPIGIMAILEAQRNVKWNPSDAQVMISDEILDVAICFQRKLIEQMIDLNLLNEDQIIAFNSWNCIAPSGLLAELGEDIEGFNPLHTSYFVANSIYIELTSFFKDMIM